MRENKASIKVLFALEGAIAGVHEAALPAAFARSLTNGRLPVAERVIPLSVICCCRRQISGSSAISRPIC
jgi:hypothetical protein